MEIKSSEDVSYYYLVIPHSYVIIDPDFYFIDTTPTFITMIKETEHSKSDQQPIINERLSKYIKRATTIGYFILIGAISSNPVIICMIFLILEAFIEFVGRDD